ncbi:heterokaryon incompatibility protein-domain-containing protein, partial [Phaeosphaeriaceae sp. PMI808]
TVDHGYQADTLHSFAYLPTAVPDTCDDQCIQVINTWISACSSSHSTCSPGHQRTTPLPRRVVDVGSEETNEAPRLFESNGELNYYISLSHCWGRGQHFVTETANLRERCTAICWASLPKTFQDAITITRKLGIRYLWIDSLCILQDDSADWDIELAKMGDIYKNSYLTIAVVSASDDQTGFLGPRTTGSIL